MTEETMDKPSPQSSRESEREFRRLMRGEGSPERLVSAIRKESHTYVKAVRAGRYRASRADRRASA